MTTEKNILVVDDEEDLRYAVQQILKSRGFAVKTASSGVEALGILEFGYVPDLVITDQDMPGMKGMKLVEEIHKSQQVPCVLMSGNEHFREIFEDNPDAQKQKGLAGFLVKPVLMQRLFAVVGQIISKP
ncbi:MAG: response regulator [bacterium]